MQSSAQGQPRVWIGGSRSCCVRWGGVCTGWACTCGGQGQGPVRVLTAWCLGMGPAHQGLFRSWLLLVLWGQLESRSLLLSVLKVQVCLLLLCRWRVRCAAALLRPERSSYFGPSGSGPQ